MTTPERRRDPRISASHLVKLKCEQTAGKYIPGTTHDVSDGGAMLMLDHPRLLTTGQKVQIGIFSNPARGMLKSEEFVEATIVRSLGHGETRGRHPHDLIGPAVGLERGLVIAGRGFLPSDVHQIAGGLPGCRAEPSAARRRDVRTQGAGSGGHGDQED